MHIMSADLAAAANELEKDWPDILVLEMPFASVGMPIKDIRSFLGVVYRDLVPKTRVVGWLGDTYGGAAIAAWGLPELIVKPGASFGPATLGARGSVASHIISEWKKVAEEAAVFSGRPLAPIASLQFGQPLFHSSPTGQDGVQWVNLYKDGWVEVRKRGEWSPFTPDEMLQFGFAIGVAGDVNELAHALGLSKFEIVGEQTNATLQSRLSAALRADSAMRELLEQYDGALGEFLNTPRPLPDAAQLRVTSLLDELNSLAGRFPGVAHQFDCDSDWIADQRKRIRHQLRGLGSR